MLVLIATWGVGIALNLIAINSPSTPVGHSMSKGDIYCPAPIPAKSNAEFGKKVMSLAECKREGLCLSADGSGCIEPIVWGDKNALPISSFRHVNSN